MTCLCVIGSSLLPALFVCVCAFLLFSHHVGRQKEKYSFDFLHHVRFCVDLFSLANYAYYRNATRRKAKKIPKYKCHIWFVSSKNNNMRVDAKPATITFIWSLPEWAAHSFRCSSMNFQFVLVVNS